MAFKRTSGRQCKFESLESRRMLAGNVVARVVGGSAVLKGDNYSNGIMISSGLNPHEVVVSGLVTGGSATTINGTAGPVTLIGVIHGLKVDMALGNNIVNTMG